MRKYSFLLIAILFAFVLATGALFADSGSMPSTDGKVVVQKTVYLGQSINDNIDKLGQIGTQGVDIARTQNGFILKSRYSPDRWVEIGNDSNGTYISVIKVVDSNPEAVASQYQQAPSSDQGSSGQQTASGSSQVQAPQSGFPTPQSPPSPPLPPAAIQASQTLQTDFDSTDAYVAAKELEYLNDKNILQPSQKSDSIDLITQVFGGTTDAAPPPPPQSGSAASSQPPQPPNGQTSAPPPPPSGETTLDMNPDALPQSVLVVPLQAGPSLRQNTTSPFDQILGMFGSQKTVAAQQGASGASATTGQQQGIFSSGFGLIAIGAMLVAAVAAVVFAVLQITVMMKPLEIDQVELHKVMSNETRFEILNQLSTADRIPTDLSLALNKSKSTISEHLEKLMEAGFVEKQEQPGKKFVFYKITSKGKTVLRRGGSA